MDAAAHVLLALALLICRGVLEIGEREPRVGWLAFVSIAAPLWAIACVGYFALALLRALT